MATLSTFRLQTSETHAPQAGVLELFLRDSPDSRLENTTYSRRKITTLRSCSFARQESLPIDKDSGIRQYYKYLYIHYTDSLQEPPRVYICSRRRIIYKYCSRYTIQREAVCPGKRDKEVPKVAHHFRTLCLSASLLFEATFKEIQ